MLELVVVIMQKIQDGLQCWCETASEHGQKGPNCISLLKSYLFRKGIVVVVFALQRYWFLNTFTHLQNKKAKKVSQFIFSVYIWILSCIELRSCVKGQINNMFFNPKCLGIKMPPEKVLGIYLLGQNSCSAGIWMSREQNIKQVLHSYCQDSGQSVLFHQPRYIWNKWIFLTKPPFGGSF